MDVTQEIRELLDSNGIVYQYFEHAPTPTSKEAARVRGTTEEQGAKALVFRSKGNFFMFVLPGDRKADFSKMKAILNTRSMSMATHEEVEKVTHCIPGGVPPFGNLFSIPVFVDRSLLRNDMIAFNAGKQTVSIMLKTEDWLRTVKPIIEEFSV